MSEPAATALTAADHIACGQALLAQAEACLDHDPDRAEILGGLADTHFRGAEALTAAAQMEVAKQMARDTKGFQAFGTDLLSQFGPRPDLP